VPPKLTPELALKELSESHIVNNNDENHISFGNDVRPA